MGKKEFGTESYIKLARLKLILKSRWDFKRASTRDEWKGNLFAHLNHDDLHNVDSECQMSAVVTPLVIKCLVTGRHFMTIDCRKKFPVRIMSSSLRDHFDRECREHTHTERRQSAEDQYQQIQWACGRHLRDVCRSVGSLREQSQILLCSHSWPVKLIKIEHKVLARL